MIESIISFSFLYLISNSLSICSQISLNSVHVVFSIKFQGNLRKMYMNNETLQKPKTKLNYLFSLIRDNFDFLNLFLRI